MSGDNVTKVLVTNVPPGCKRDKLYMYFQKTINGGGDIKSFAYPIPGRGSNAAVIEFVDETVAQFVIGAEHHEFAHVRLRASKFEPGLFESAKIYLSKPKFEEILKKHDDIKEFIEDSGVTIDEWGGSPALLGDWYPILSVAERFDQLSLLSKENDVVEKDSRTTALTNIGEGSSAEASEGSSLTIVDKAADEQSADQTQMNVDQDYTTSGYGAMYSTSASKDNQLTLDKDIVDFMDLTMKERMDNLRNEFQINLSIVGEDVVAESHNGGESGFDKLKEFYHETIARVTQKNFPLPENMELEEIEDAIVSIKNRYPGIHISLVGDGKQVLFVADSSEDCSEAESQFRLKVHGLRPITQEWFANYSSVPLFVHQFPVTELKVTIHRGDIAEQRVDAIVNAANAGLRDGAGVTGAIFRAGGDEFRHRCRELIRFKDRALYLGEVVHTVACGGLQCDNVLHVVGPVWRDLPKFERKEECQKIMDLLCYNLIQYANREVSSRSIAIPAIGTGIYGVPLSIFCIAMMNSIYSYQDVLLKGEQTASLREIRIVNYDVQEATDIKRRFEEVFCAGAPESSV